MNDCGVIYLVLNRPIFMQMCMLSMMSLRKSGYEGPIAVATDFGADAWRDAEERFGALPSPRFQIIPLDRSSDAQIPEKAYKARLGRVAPFHRTLYLDCDTIICRSTAPLWDQTTTIDPPLALALGRAHTLASLRRQAPTWASAEWEETIRLCGANARHYNSGVIYWSSNTAIAISKFFAVWESEAGKDCLTDQAPLVRALLLSNCSPKVLCQFYNVQNRQKIDLASTVIRHFSGIEPHCAYFRMYALYHRLYLNHFVRKATGSKYSFEDVTFASAALVSDDNVGIGDFQEGGGAGDKDYTMQQRA